MRALVQRGRPPVYASAIWRTPLLYEPVMYHGIGEELMTRPHLLALLVSHTDFALPICLGVLPPIPACLPLPIPTPLPQPNAYIQQPGATHSIARRTLLPSRCPPTTKPPLQMTKNDEDQFVCPLLPPPASLTSSQSDSGHLQLLRKKE